MPRLFLADKGEGEGFIVLMIYSGSRTYARNELGYFARMLFFSTVRSKRLHLQCWYR